MQFTKKLNLIQFVINKESMFKKHVIDFLVTKDAKGLIESQSDLK